MMRSDETLKKQRRTFTVKYHSKLIKTHFYEGKEVADYLCCKRHNLFVLFNFLFCIIKNM